MKPDIKETKKYLSFTNLENLDWHFDDLPNAGNCIDVLVLENHYGFNLRLRRWTNNIEKLDNFKFYNQYGFNYRGGSFYDYDSENGYYSISNNKVCAWCYLFKENELKHKRLK